MLAPRSNRNLLNPVFSIATLMIVMFLATPAHAASTGLPWESLLERIATSVTGPVAQSLLVIAIALLGFGIAFSETPFIRRSLGVIFGGVIAVFAASLVIEFFGFTSGATF